MQLAALAGGRDVDLAGVVYEVLDRAAGMVSQAKQDFVGAGLELGNASIYRGFDNNIR